MVKHNSTVDSKYNSIHTKCYYPLSELLLKYLLISEFLKKVFTKILHLHVYTWVPKYQTDQD